MKVNAQIWIDRHIIKHLVWLLNGLVRVVGKILRLNHELNRSFDRVAVAKYKGMGSILQATALLKSLRNKYPNAKIVFVSTKSNKAFLETLPMIDDLILLDDSDVAKLILGFPGFIWKLLSRRFEVFIDLEIYAHFSSLVTTLSAAQNRLGYFMQSRKYRHGTYTHLIYFNPKAPMSQVYLQMARLLHIDDVTAQLYDYQHLNISTDRLGVKEPYLVINPNASDLRLERRWPANYFVALVEELSLKKPSHQLVFIGAASEAEYTKSITDSCVHSNLLNLTGKTNLQELIALIKNAELMISNDTGPLHIAFACRTKAIGLFGPISPTQFVIPPESVAIYQNVYCSPCVHEFDRAPCQGNNVCMQNILVAEVIQAVDKISEKKYIQLNHSDIKYLSNGHVLGIIKRTDP